MEYSTPKCVTRKHGKPKEKAKVIESSRKLKNKHILVCMIHHRVSGQTPQKWLDGRYTHQILEVGNTYNISGEKSKWERPLGIL
jgi:hypothetical protein